MPSSPQKSPYYALHREVSGADGAPAITDKSKGMNMLGYETANIQIVPVGTANPSVAVQWWSEEDGEFITEHTAIAKTGLGNGIPYEFSVNCYGRIMFVKVTTITGVTKILVSGFGKRHPE